MVDALDEGSTADEANERADELQIAEAAKSDPAAFGELYDRYYPRVYRYVYHRIGNTPDAEDLTAQVFMKALEAIPSFRTGRSGFAPWIFRIARNAVVDFYRRGRKHDPLEEAENESSEDDPASEALKGESRRELHSMVAQLSPEQREVVLMRFSADLSYAEIAGALRKNEAAVRMLVHRGLRKLKAVHDERS